MTETATPPVTQLLIEVEVSQNVYSSADGQIGNWTLRKQATLTAIPPVGTSFVFSNGDPDTSQITETVKHVFFYDGGGITVELSAIVTDNPDILRELAIRLDHGWKVLGGPWQ
jgi:hypothetical protein